MSFTHYNFGQVVHTPVMWIFHVLQPERIDPKNFARGYDVRSDVWSLGITLVCVLLFMNLNFRGFSAIVYLNFSVLGVTKLAFWDPVLLTGIYYFVHFSQ